MSSSHQGPPQLVGANVGSSNHHIIPIAGIHHQEMIVRPGTNISAFTTESLGLSHRTIMSNSNHSKLLAPPLAGGTAGLVSSRKQGQILLNNNLARISTSPVQGRSQKQNLMSPIEPSQQQHDRRMTTGGPLPAIKFTNKKKI